MITKARIEDKIFSERCRQAREQARRSVGDDPAAMLGYLSAQLVCREMQLAGEMEPPRNWPPQAMRRIAADIAQAGSPVPAEIGKRTQATQDGLQREIDRLNQLMEAV